MHPILLTLGPIHIYSFGVFLTIALFVGAFYVWREGKNEFTDEIILDTIVAATMAAILGARLFYIFFHFESFGFNLLCWLHFYLYPGFSFWGGIIGGLWGAFWFTKRKSVSFWRIADFLVLGAALGQIFGQIGCFLNGCTVGRATTLPWGMTTAGFLGKRHPVALYDALAACLIFFVLLRVYHWIFAQRRKREGSGALAFLALASLFSFPLEFLKEGGVYFYGLSLNQWVALAFFLVPAILFYYRLRNFRQDMSGALAYLNKQLGKFSNRVRLKEGGKSD